MLEELGFKPDEMVPGVMKKQDGVFEIKAFSIHGAIVLQVEVWHQARTILNPNQIEEQIKLLKEAIRKAINEVQDESTSN